MYNSMRVSLTIICLYLPFYEWAQLQKPNSMKIWASSTVTAKQI